MIIALAAQEMAGLKVLQQLAPGPHQVALVLTEPPDSPRSGGANLWQAAEALGLDVAPARLVRDPALAATLHEKNVDILLNVHSLHIISAEVLAASRYGAYNLHPSLLPRYAGLNSVSWSILHGEKEHGVTVHKMEPGIDTGPIAYQERFPLGDQMTAFDLSFKCTQVGISLILKLVESISRSPHELPLIPQDLSRREYFGGEVPGDGHLHWSDSAEQIANFIRACDYFPFQSPWGHPRTQLRNRELAVVKGSRTGQATSALPGTVGEKSGAGVLVAAKDEWVLVSKVKTDGRHFPAGDILTPGECLGPCETRAIGAIYAES